MATECFCEMTALLARFGGATTNGVPLLTHAHKYPSMEPRKSRNRNWLDCTPVLVPPEHLSYYRTSLYSSFVRFLPRWLLHRANRGNLALLAAAQAEELAEEPRRESAVQHERQVVPQPRHEQRPGGEIAGVEADDVGALARGVEHRCDDHAVILRAAR